MSLETEDQEAAEVKKDGERVTLAEMEAKIRHTIYVTGDKLLPEDAPDDLRKQMSILTLCVLVMDNWFILTGKSCPADARVFDADYGRKLAYDDAIRQLWRYEGYALRTKLSKA